MSVSSPAKRPVLKASIPPNCMNGTPRSAELMIKMVRTGKDMIFRNKFRSNSSHCTANLTLSDGKIHPTSDRIGRILSYHEQSAANTPGVESGKKLIRNHTCSLRLDQHNMRSASYRFHHSKHRSSHTASPPSSKTPSQSTFEDNYTSTSEPKDRHLSTP